MNQEELKVRLDSQSEKLEKISTEIVVLQAAVVAAGNVTPEVQASLERLESLTQAADDLNTDAPEGGE